MSRYCRECEQLYNIKLTESPTVKCTLCKVGKHECEESNKVKENIGLYWFCNECDKIFEKQYLHKIDRNALFIGFEEQVKDKQTEKNNTSTEENNKSKNNSKGKQPEDQKEKDKDTQKQKDQEHEKKPAKPDTEQKNKKN